MKSKMGYEDRLMTLEEVCAIVGLSKSTVYKLSHRKLLRHIKTGFGGGGRLRFSEQDVFDWIRARTIQSIGGDGGVRRRHHAVAEYFRSAGSIKRSSVPARSLYLGRLHRFVISAFKTAPELRPFSG